MSDVDVLLEPVNGGKNQLPIVRADDKVFMYDNKGLHTLPAKDFPERNSWKNVGKVVLANSKVAFDVTVKAYELYAEKYTTWDAIKSNPVQFANDFLSVIMDTEFEHIEDQDWENVVVDVKEHLGKSSDASRGCLKSVGSFFK